MFTRNPRTHTYMRDRMRGMDKSSSGLAYVSNWASAEIMTALLKNKPPNSTIMNHSLWSTLGLLPLWIGHSFCCKYSGCTSHNCLPVMVIPVYIPRWWHRGRVRLIYHGLSPDRWDQQAITYKSSRKVWTSTMSFSVCFSHKSSWISLIDR